MENKIKELLKHIGQPYEMYNSDGSYQGCFFPVQFLYPDKPRYKLRSLNDDDKNLVYGMAKLNKHCTEITEEELQKGDIIACRFRDELHVAIYYEFGKCIEVFKDHTLQIGRINKFKNPKFFKVNK